MIVGKEFTFHAAHHDATSGPDHQCGRPHGHTYKLVLEVEGPTNERGMVIHGDDLKAFYHGEIEPFVEHKDLNETLVFNPTMEAVCAWIHSTLRSHLDSETHTCRVTLWETPTMYCVAP